MHFTSFSLLALATTSLAGPVKRSESFQVQHFSAALYSNNTLGTLAFTVHDPTAHVGDACYLSWNPSGEIQPGIEMNKCAHNKFQFGFRYGLGSIENFTLDLQRVNSTQIAYQVVAAQATDSKWKCTQNPDAATKERCEYVGILDINV
ncbi:hypothetical protein N7468_001161 [Penicillium chermesinum]|uniref:AA1-like domain-containing protein n=1 Tax=Penicillium chermesinum TaxID=63820 RepID=A0A9W9PIB3_9EURO|nr:uncharacterized protein N7468_001161 [Penicillium chermesinum]KAJ5246178.1 hypothetical protein N7468_001161 [Penicillium chermesinum]